MISKNPLQVHMPWKCFQPNAMTKMLHRKPSGLDSRLKKLKYTLKLKIKHNDWLLADTLQQAANHCALF